MLDRFVHWGSSHSTEVFNDSVNNNNQEVDDNERHEPAIDDFEISRLGNGLAHLGEERCQHQHGRQGNHDAVL